MLCVAPAWNEGERIARVVKAPRDLVETTVVVDDGSTDDTAAHAVSEARLLFEAVQIEASARRFAAASITE